MTDKKVKCTVTAERLDGPAEEYFKVGDLMYRIQVEGDPMLEQLYMGQKPVSVGRTKMEDFLRTQVIKGRVPESGLEWPPKKATLTFKLEG